MWGFGKSYKHDLEDAPFQWSEYDPFHVRDLLNGGVLILGRAGSGKTSSSGRMLLQEIAHHPHSAGLGLAAKPEDAEMWRHIFRKAGRLNDLIVFEEDGPWRTNFLHYLGAGHTQNVVQCLMSIGETLKRGERSGKDEAFWESLNERFLWNDVAALQAAAEPVSADRILKFLITAATDPAQLSSEAFQSGYHSKVLERGSQTPHSKKHAGDYRLALDFWTQEYPAMDPKTRSNGLAGVMNILHPFNTGLVKEMVSGDVNVSPDAILNGYWVLVNFSPSIYGDIGRFINAGWKYLTQLAILKSKADHRSPFCVLWADEYAKFCNKFDAHFICQARSHKGALCALLQSVASIYAAMPGEAGHHFADALLANFSHSIIHASDPVTAKWASAKLGRKKQILMSGGFSPQHGQGVWDELMGNVHFHGSFSEHYEDVLQMQDFQHGMRTGGPANGWLADAVVIKSGEPFANGRNHLRVAFRQRG